MAARAVIFGCSGPVLTTAESAMLRAADPWGFILFARNVEGPAQLSRLTASLRDAVGRNAPVLVDQEGGRVQRLRAPHWREWPAPLAQLAGLPPGRAARAMYLRYRLIAAELAAVGIDVNCAPLADIAQDDTHPVLRNRTYGCEPDAVVDAARAVAQGLMAGGVLPVLKHIPGHGRAATDSHAELPVVRADPEALWDTDFATFAALADLPMAMTAHVVFEGIDPHAPATTSAVMNRLIREEIGFDGLLMTDDISMQALHGDVADRAQAALDAGCDMVLHCNGNDAEMRRLAERVPPLAGRALQRADAALARRVRAAPADLPALLAELSALTQVPAHG